MGGGTLLKFQIKSPANLRVAVRIQSSKKVEYNKVKIAYYPKRIL